MTRPKLLDLFCCQGGAAMGYHRAGFDVVGVDIEPQPRYPFEFIQADALEYVAAHGHEYDAIHASPPCQRYSHMSNCIPGLSGTYPDLIAATRALLKRTRKPFVIENVAGARSSLEHPVMLCGLYLGLKVYRHRFFETYPFFLAPPHIPHRDSTPKAGRGRSPKGFISVAGHMPDTAYCMQAMGIDWMTGDGLAEAIPPAYTEWIGRQLIQAIIRSRENV